MKSIFLILLFITASLSFYSTTSFYTPDFVAFEITHKLTLNETNDIPPFPDIVHNYDVRHYKLDLSFDEINRVISGYCEVRLRATENLNQVTLLLAGLIVDGITMEGVNQNYSRDGEHLNISLSQSFNTGQDFTLHINYHGTPVHGMQWGTGFVQTQTEPDLARWWFPCYDHPSDKADEGNTVTMHVPSGRDAVSQGILLGHIGDTWNWNSQYPIATYLISIAIMDFDTIVQYYQSMPMTTWYEPSDLTYVLQVIDKFPQMMAFFSDRFGTYPFILEKYDSVGIEGSMENQTATSLCFPQVPEFYAHEMAHQWFGDDVTLGDWNNTWLNEGFAQYACHLWTQFDEGETPFINQMIIDANNYFAADQIDRYPLVGTPYWLTIDHYCKGAWVLHMLRKVLGDTNWWNMMKNYRETFSGGNVITSDFQAKAEEFYGQNMDWFFDEWVYQAGYPILMYSFSNIGPGPNSIDVRITQTQSGYMTPTFFKMPIDIRLVTSLGYEDHTVWLYDVRSCFHFTAAAPVTNVILDPNTWLLHKEFPAVGVNVTNFTAQRHPASVNLSWECISSNVYFDLYRSIVDGKQTMVVTEMLKQGDYKKINTEKITGHTPFSYVDAGLSAKLSYQYILVGTDSAGKQETFGPISAEARTLVQAFSLERPRPNPARSLAIFTGNADSTHPAQLEIYDLSGRIIQKHAIPVGSGTWQWDWNLTDSAGQRLSNGVYIIAASAGGQRYNTRLVVAH